MQQAKLLARALQGWQIYYRIKKNENSSAVWPGRRNYLYLKETRQKEPALAAKRGPALPKAVNSLTTAAPRGDRFFTGSKPSRLALGPSILVSI